MPQTPPSWETPTRGKNPRGNLQPDKAGLQRSMYAETGRHRPVTEPPPGGPEENRESAGRGPRAGSPGEGEPPASPTATQGRKIRQDERTPRNPLRQMRRQSGGSPQGGTDVLRRSRRAGGNMQLRLPNAPAPLHQRHGGRFPTHPGLRREYRKGRYAVPAESGRRCWPQTMHSEPTTRRPHAIQTDRRRRWQNRTGRGGQPYTPGA